MRNTLFLTIFLFPGFILSQISREFSSDKINGNVTKAIETSYQDVTLDKNGKPILSDKALRETIHYYQDGLAKESHHFENIGDQKELFLKVLISRVEGVISWAQVFSYTSGKESLLRFHEAELKNGKIVSEVISDDEKEMGRATYSYGVTNNGYEFENVFLEGNRGTGNFYTEKDKNGIVLSAEIMEQDTVMMMKRVEVHGDSIRKYQLVHRNSYNNKVDSILMIQRSWFDNNRNPILTLQQMDAITDPPPGEPNSANFVSAFSYSDTKIVEKASSTISVESLYGEWRNKKYNIELFFEPRENNEQRMFGSSFWSKSNEPTIQEYLDTGEIWKVMLKQDLYAYWSIQPNGQLQVTLKNGSILTFNMELDYHTLVLTPDMKNMKGALRLSKSN